MHLRPVQRELFGHRTTTAAPHTALAEVAPLPRWGRALRRRGWVPALVLAASCGGGAVAHAWMQPLYEATASVEVQTPVPEVRFASAAPANPSLDTDPVTQMQTVAEEMGSRRLVGQSALPFGPQIEYRFWRRARPRTPPNAPGSAAMRQLRVTTVPQSRLIQLQFKAPRPDQAAQFLSRLIANYMEDVQTRQRSAGRQRVAWLAIQTDAARARVVAAQDDVLQLAARHGLADPASQLALASQRWQQLASAETAAEIAGLGQGDALSAGVAPAPASSPMASTATPPASAATPLELELKRADLKTTIGRLAAQYRPEAAPLLQARKELAALDASLAAYRQENLQAARRWLDAERQQARDLAAALAKQTRNQTTLQQTLAEFDLAERNLRAGQTVYSDLLDQLQQAAAATGEAPPPLRVVDPAQPPAFPSNPDLATTLAYAAALGCSLGVLAMWGLEAADDAIRMPEAREMGVALTAIVPRRAAGLDGCLDSCVASLLLAQTEAGLRVVHITSVGTGEGKTTVALQVARQLAEVSSAVLVLDGNPHHPAVHNADGGAVAPGLRELLAGSAEIEEVLRGGARMSPWLIPAGSASDGSGTSHPGFAVQLASGAMSDLLAAARLRYDWVVVDGSPLLAGPEAGIWASLADCSLVVASRGHTSRRQLRRCLDALEAGGAAHLGLVLNRARARETTPMATAWLARPPQSEPEVAQLRQRA